MKTKSDELSDQLLMPGVLSERDIFLSCMKRLGSKGGRANTPAQMEARRLSMLKINENRKGKKKRK